MAIFTQINYIPKNNICELINNKLSIAFLNDNLIKDNIIRKDYKTISLLKLIENLDFNNDLKQVEFLIFKNVLNQ